MNLRLFALAPFFFFSSLTADSHPGQVVRVIACPPQCLCPTGLTVRQGKLWVVDRFSDSLYEMDLQSGRVLRTVAAPCWQPYGLATDQEGKLWVGSDQAEYFHDQLYRVDPDSGRVIAQVPSPVDFVRSLTWEGKALWLGTKKDQLLRVDPADGSVLSTSPIPSKEMSGLGFDGKYLWSGDKRSNRIYMIEPRSGEVVFVLPTPGPSVSGLACAGDMLYVLDYQKRCIFEVRRTGDQIHWTSRPRSLRLCYRVILHNQGSSPAPKLTAYVAIPKETKRQKLLSKIRWEPKPSAVVTDNWDLPLARFDFFNVAPGATVEARMHVDVELYTLRRALYPEQVKGLSAIPKVVKERYLANGNKYQLEHPFLRKLVKETLQGEKNPWWIARKLARAVGERMNFELAGGWEPAPVVLKRGSGSCSEYSFAFIALCRIAGLPARYVGSIVVRGEDGSCDETFHRWAQIYLPPYGWVNYDVQAADATYRGIFAEKLGFRGNHRLVTTAGGGPSNILVWEYNSQVEIQGKNQTDIVVEKYGEWSPLD